MKSIVLKSIFVIFPFCIFSHNINIDYKVGGYGFGEKGEYEIQEIFKIYSENRNNKLSYIQLKKSWIYNELTKRNDLSKIDTIIFGTHKVSEKKITKFFQEINKNRNNFNYDIISQNIKKTLTKNEIIRIAKKRDIFYLIGDEETNKLDEFDRKKIREIKKLKNFDKYIDYIKPKSDTIDTRVFADAWNFAIIETSNKKLRFDFFNDLGQPIKIENTTSINLNINKELKLILPKNSYLRKQIEFESLYEDYIYWFLKNYG